MHQYVLRMVAVLHVNIGDVGKTNSKQKNLNWFNAKNVKKYVILNYENLQNMFYYVGPHKIHVTLKSIQNDKSS